MKWVLCKTMTVPYSADDSTPVNICTVQKYPHDEPFEVDFPVDRSVKPDKPALGYHIVQVPDSFVPKIQNDKDAFLLPFAPDATPADISLKTTLANGFAAQNCNVDLSLCATLGDCIDTVLMVVTAAKGAVLDQPAPVIL